MTPLSLAYLERAPREPSPNPPLVVLLHGRGAEAKTIFSIEGLLDPRFHVLAITAPYPSAIGGREWFPPKEIAADKEIDDVERFDEPEKLLTKEIQLHLERLKAASAPLFLWGFSQGAAMSLILGLRGKIAPRGVIPMSGFLPSPIVRWHMWSHTSRYLLVHGDNDEVISAESSQKTLRFLQPKGIDGQYYEYHGRHKMSLDSIAYINEWITQLTTPQPPPTPLRSAGGGAQND